MPCCDAPLNNMFDDDFARAEADSFRRHGLPKRARKLVAALESALPLAGKRILEIGVGVGGVTIELLRRGAGSATGVDAAAAQLEHARALAEEAGVADRFELVLSDFAETSQVGQADVVVLDRVVCCYPDWRALLTAAARHADAGLAMTYPRGAWWLRAVAWIGDLYLERAHDGFKFFVHSPSHMHALLAEHGFHTRVVGHYFMWEIAVASRRG